MSHNYQGHLCIHPEGIGTDPMQARREEYNHLCTYPRGIEYAGIVEKVEVEIETKVI